MINPEAIYFPDTFPDLQTNRLILREYANADVAALNQLRNNAQVNEHLFRKNAETPEKTAAIIGQLQQSFKDKTGLNWAIADRATQQHIGYLGFWKVEGTYKRAEAGYLLHPSWWRKGLMSEALSAALMYAFRSMGLNRVEAFVKPSNAASVRLLQQQGFKQEACLREYYTVDGQPSDCLIFGKLASD